ncbi:hypothetical protein Tco_0834202 [Tanacetum coccineum]
MNDKSKDTTKARQDLKNLGIRSELWLGQNKNEKCSKPHDKYSFTPDNRKKFCQFIKGVKLPDGFRSKFKHKEIDNDSNITGMESHDCHIMMQRLLSYGLQQYLDTDVSKPIIKLCSFFKQICSRTLMEDDMVKAKSWLPHDLADFDDEVLANDDDDDVVMSATVARGHGGDGGGDDPSRPPPCLIGIGCRGVGGRKATRGGSRQGTHKETRNLGLKKVTDEHSPLKIRFEFNDKGMMLHLSENFTRWNNLQHFDLTPTSAPSFGKNQEGHQSVYGQDPDLPQTTHRHSGICKLTIGLTLSTLLEPLKMLKTGQRARSFAGRDPAHWLSSEIIRWRAPRPMSANTPTGVPYTEDQIMAMVRKGKQRGNIPGVGVVLAGQGRDAISIDEPRGTYTDAKIDEIKEHVQGLVYLILSNSSNVFSKSKMTKSFSFKPARSVSIRRIFAAIAEIPSGGEESPSSSSRGMRSFLTSEEDLCRFD